MPNKFVYLGSLIYNNGDCSEELKRRTDTPQIKKKLTRIWKDQSISKTFKAMLADTLIFPVSTYESEINTPKMN